MLSSWNNSELDKQVNKNQITTTNIKIILSDYMCIDAHLKYTTCTFQWIETVR